MLTAVFLALLIAVGTHVVLGRAAFRVGVRRGARMQAAVVESFASNPAIGTLAWQKMVANAVARGELNPHMLVTDQIHLFHRLDEEDQRLVIEAARAALQLALQLVNVGAAPAPPVEAP